MQEAADGTVTRMFFVRGKLLRNHLLTDERFQELTYELISKHLIFGFNREDQRSLSPNTTRLLGPSLSSVWDRLESTTVDELRTPHE